MTMFLIQSAILLAIAFLIGCIIGCLLRRMVASEEATVPVAAAATVATVATMGAAARFAAEPAVSKMPPVVPVPAPVAAPVAQISTIAPAKPTPVAAPEKIKATASAKAKAVTPKAIQPKAIVSAAPVVAKSAKPDDLKLIVGIGPVNERKLHALEVRRFAQIAAWSPKDEETYGQKLEFPGRIEREEWVRQAKNLAAGGKSEDASELKRRKGASASTAMPANLLDTTAKASMPAKSIAKPPQAKAKPVAPVKKPIPAKLDKAIGGKPDNLTLIDGIGNVIEKKLNEMGVFHFEQIANWTMAQAETFSKAIGFPGRALREEWVKEAAIFAKGGTTDHAKKVEAGKITTSRISTSTEKGGKKS